MTGFSHRLDWIAAAVFLTGALAEVGAAPVLRVERVGVETVQVNVVRGSLEKGWVLQDSYDGRNWRDLAELSGVGFGERLSEVPSDERYFRAAEKPMATRQEALTEARERWRVAGLRDYQYRLQTNNGRLFADDLILVADGEVVEATSMLPPGFPSFGFGEQTIEVLFDRLQGAVDGEVHSMAVRYHPTLGYPERAYVDFSEMIADEEWGFSVLEEPKGAEEGWSENWALWEWRGVGTYEFDLRYETARYAWSGRVRVEGEVATVIDGREPSKVAIIMPMGGYFAAIGDSLAKGGVTSGAYDRELGYPVFFSRDWYLTDFDGPGERFWISGLRGTGGE